MKRISLLLTLFLILGMSSCKLDNYEGPNAKIFGSFIDQETNELVEQDILRGTTIEYVEHGYASQTKQYLIVRNDGTYRNNLVFANKYTITPVRGNFVAMEPREVDVKGETQLDFRVQPYLRIKDFSITKVGTKVVATFKVQQTVPNKVQKIGLYVHREPSVGEPMRTAFVESDINSVVDPNQVHTLEIDLPSNSALKAGSPYYFRVGARIDVGEAKFNYAKAVRLTL